MASMEVSVADDLRQLIAKKDAIEKDLKELATVLESQEGVGMTGSLLDKDQFPRADIDVYSVRHSRQRIIRLQNDLKEVMRQVETGLHALHSEARSETAQGMDVDRMPSGPTPQKRPFARVALVDAGSPAFTAGLQTGDELVEFGSVTHENFTSLQDIAAVVQHSKGATFCDTGGDEGCQDNASVSDSTDMERAWATRMQNCADLFLNMNDLSESVHNICGAVKTSVDATQAETWRLGCSTHH